MAYNPSESDFDLLSSQLSCGFVVSPSNENFAFYAQSSVSAFDPIRIPNGIVFCQCEDDVITTLNWINHDLPQFVDFRIRSGGHSNGAYSKATDELLIDLSLMKNIDININGEHNLLSIEPGATLQDYEIFKQNNPSYDRTVPHGLCGLVGFGGHATGGGIGLTGRKYGALVDYIKGVRVVLCDGSVWEIFEDDEYDAIKQDLLYAIKGGGGGNFGVITKYYFDTISDPERSYFAELSFPITSRDDIFNTFDGWQNFINFYENNEYGLYLNIRPTFNDEANNYPFSYNAIFLLLYLPTSDDEQTNTQIFDEMVDKISEYMADTTYISSRSSLVYNSPHLTDIYLDHIYPFAFNPTYRHFPTSRLIPNELSDDIINVITDQFEKDIIISPTIINGVVHLLFLDDLGGKLSDNNPKSSWSNINRKAFGSSLSGFAFQDNDISRAKAKEIRDEWEEEIYRQISSYKYLNFMDDTNDVNIYQFYEADEIEQLSNIHDAVDPNSCFKFELGIHQKQTGSSSSSSSSSSDYP